MVTRSLVSYDPKGHSKSLLPDKLNGHQIIGELRQPTAVITFEPDIEWSPDHW